MDKPGCSVSLALFGLGIAAVSGSSVGTTFGIMMILIGIVWFYGGVTESKAKDQIRYESNAGNYIMGLPSYDSPLPNIKMIIEKEEIVLLQVQSPYSSSFFKLPPLNFVQVGSIPLRLITDINVSDQSVFERQFGGVIGLRVGYGVLGVPMQRQIYHELFYLVLSWTDGRFERHTVFQFPGEGSHQRANHLANELIKAANAL